ncbi:cobalt transporter [Tateyamaria omphalii]|uniref:energy-coupling factor ABC transporter permease n=1 Tax=Tateyamaria omphalii TaxID=299262 RepID=UPI0016735B83|nr:energy-coupling factor ABC transporter permease [Tateyamaria omphalii]GGX49863.1 cobalt transporter [Tateyamaria omphalii]
MHIEPGVVDGAKMALAYGTATAAAGYSFKLAFDDLKQHSVPSFVLRTVMATVGTFVFFEVLPHFAVGVSEVHFILGTTLFLLLGPATAAFGLVFGLLIQGAFFAPSDMPMFFVNVTTLLFPLFAVHALARRIVPQATAYVDLDYTQVLKMSAVYQGGVVAWVAFWAIYGQGVGAENIQSVLAFGGAYLLVILIEPIADLAVLAGAKALRGAQGSGIFTNRLYEAA